MSPFPTIALSLLRVIASLPGESAIKLLISSSDPETIFAPEAARVMMASINPNKTPAKFFLRGDKRPSSGSSSQIQVAAIRGRGDDERTPLERSLTVSGAAVICYALLQGSRVLQQRLQVKFRLPIKVSADPWGACPDNDAGGCPSRPEGGRAVTLCSCCLVARGMIFQGCCMVRLNLFLQHDSLNHVAEASETRATNTQSSHIC